MKKIVRAIALFIALVSIALLCSACSVGGRKYVFDDVVLNVTTSIDAEEADEGIEFFRTLLKDMELHFDRDGTLIVKARDTDEDAEEEFIEETFYWKESGDRVYINGEKDFEIEDEEYGYIEKTFNSVIFTLEVEAGYLQFIFKAKF